MAVAAVAVGQGYPRCHPPPTGSRALRKAKPPPSTAVQLGLLKENATRPTLRVELGLNRSRSALVGSELRAIVSEINRIWAQAGVCFEVHDVRHGFGARQRLVLWFVQGDVPFASGYYENDTYVWSEDAPKLRRAPHPAKIGAARTAAHELGHALGLRHVPRVGEWVDGLMNTGYDGTALAPFEIRAAREKAYQYALPNVREGCLPPRL